MFAFTDDKDIDSQISIIPIDANLDFLIFILPPSTLPPL